MKWTPTDLIALIITITICLILLTVVGRSTIVGDPLEPGGREIVGKLMYALITLLGVYVGNKIKKGD